MVMTGNSEYSKPLLHVSSEESRSEEATGHDIQYGSFEKSLDKDEFAPERVSNVSQATINIMNSAIGAGIVALPFAFREAGYMLGSLLVVFVVFLSVATLKILTRAMLATRKYTYEATAQSLLGANPFFNYFIKFVLFFIPLGSCTAYVDLVGDSLPPVIESLSGTSGWWTAKPFITMVLLCLVMAPLSAMRNMKSLAFSSLIAVCSMSYIMVMIPASFNGVASDVSAFNFTPEGIFRSLPIAVYAFNMHIVVFPVMSELKDPTEKRTSRVIYIGVLLCGILYIIVSVMGYLSFGSHTCGDILLSYGKDDVFASIARIAVAITVCLSYPVQHFVARRSLIGFFLPPEKRVPNSIHYGTTLLLAALCWTIGTFVPQVEIVTGVTGAFGMTIIMYVLPPLILLVILQRVRNESIDPKPFLRTRIGSWLLGIYGVSMVIMCTSVTVYFAVNKPKKPAYCL